MPHKARHLINGEKVPSVTTVCGMWVSQGLIFWRGKVGNEEANRIMKESAGFGDIVHEGVLNYFTTGKIEVVGNPAFLERAKVSVERVARWADEAKFVPEASEFEVESVEDMFHGTADVRGRFQNDPNTLWVGDYKTSNALDEKMPMQLSAYAKAFNEMNKLEWADQRAIRHGFIIRLAKDPTAEVQFEAPPVHYLDRVYPAFKGLRTAYDYVYRKRQFAEVPKFGKYEEKEK